MTKELPNTDVFWAEIENEETYLFKADSLNAIAETEIKKGSILYFYNQKGLFYEVYTKKPDCLTEETKDKYRFFIYKPKYKKIIYNEIEAKLYELPFSPYRSYFKGIKGGCYYINKHGNKIYVNRNFCNKSKATSNYNSNNKSGKSVQCSGRTKKGNRCRNKTTNSSGRCHLH